MSLDPNDWGRRLDAGETHDDELGLAARLRRARPAPAQPDPRFTKTLRARLTRRQPARVSVRFAIVGTLTAAVAALTLGWMIVSRPGPLGDNTPGPWPTAMCYFYPNGQPYPAPVIDGAGVPPATLEAEATFYAEAYPGEARLNQQALSVNATAYATIGAAAQEYYRAHEARCTALPAEQRATELALAQATGRVHWATDEARFTMTAALFTPTPTYVTETPTLIPTATEAVRPTATPNLTPMPALPIGLIYTDSGHLWQVGEDGQSLDRGPIPAGAVLDATGQTALYLRDNDIWVLDLATQQERNLTNSPDRTELEIGRWPQQPGSVVVVTRPGAGTPAADEWTAELGRLDVADGLYEPIASIYWPGLGYAFSPDGQYLVFPRELDWVMRNLADGSEQVLPINGVLIPPETGRGLDPAFSPDGRWLALSLAWRNETSGQGSQGLWLLDRQSGEARQVGAWEFFVEGRESTPFPTVWTPNADWVLLFNETDYEWGHRPVRLADGYVGALIPGLVRHFSPDSQQAVVELIDSDSQGAPRYAVYETQSWTSRGAILLPAEAVVVGWR